MLTHITALLPEIADEPSFGCLAGAEEGGYAGALDPLITLVLIAGILILSIVLCGLGALLTARAATSPDPVRALRTE